jgi:hypothetical protein
MEEFYSPRGCQEEKGETGRGWDPNIPFKVHHNDLTNFH